MNDPELRELLEQLHTEIEQTDAVDDRARELLRHLNGDIRELLDRSEHAPLRARASTVRRLEESIRELEVSHPTLTGMLSKLLATLSNAGI